MQRKSNEIWNLMHDKSSVQLLTTRDLAFMLQVTRRQIYRLVSNRGIPAPRRVGGGLRWVASEIAGWGNAGCPDEQTWNILRESA